MAEKRRPRFMHAFVFEHPEFTFDDVRVDDSKILGGLGGGLELTKEWFMDERLLIAARSLGGAERCLDVAFAYAIERRQFGSRIFDYQAVRFQLADCAVELQAARAMTYQVAWEIDRKEVDAKTLHAKSASVKLFASQMANRVADRCVQVLGGRGYMRENPVERLYRDLRVDRIWEGTDEIQKLIVANELAKRGRGGLCAWPGIGSRGADVAHLARDAPPRAAARRRHRARRVEGLRGDDGARHRGRGGRRDGHDRLLVREPRRPAAGGAGRGRPPLRPAARRRRSPARPPRSTS